MSDLSHIYANSDLEEAQQHHAELPHEAKLHFAMGFAHAAGRAPHPGVYKGPAITPPDGEGQLDAAENFGLRQEARNEAIANIAGGENPVIPSPPQKLGAAPDFSDLGS